MKNVIIIIMLCSCCIGYNIEFQNLVVNFMLLLAFLKTLCLKGSFRCWDLVRTESTYVISVSLKLIVILEDFLV